MTRKHLVLTALGSFHNNYFSVVINKLYIELLTILLNRMLTKRNI